MSAPTLERYVTDDTKEQLPFMETYVAPTIEELDERLQIVREAGVSELPFETLGYNISPLVYMENARADMAPGKSFKARGAYYAMKKAVQRGMNRFSTASAGNHAQGAANAASLLDVSVDIFMPAETPMIKVQGIRDLSDGAFVEIHQHKLVNDQKVPYDTFDQAQKAAIEMEDAEFLSPFDNYDVISGQGTLIYEMLLQKPDLDVLHLTVGGGGLLASALEVVDVMKKAGLIKQSLKVVAVMLEGNDSLLETQKNNWILCPATDVDSFAEGGAVNEIGAIPAALIEKYEEHLETEVVTKDDMARALWYVEEANRLRSDDNKLPLDETTALVVRAGALVRAERRNLEGGKGKENWMTITTGSNASEEKLDELRALYVDIYNQAVAEYEQDEAERQNASTIGRECLALSGFVGR